MGTIYFIYITTNLLNSKQYVGYHSTKNLDDGYLGSGVALHLAIKKYGKENFKREIIKFLNDNKTHLLLEEYYINEFNSLTPNGYNISPAGGLGLKNSLSDEMKKKISASCKGRSAWNKGKVGVYSKESLKKMSESQKGNKLDDNVKEKISKKLKGRSVWNKGKKLTEEHKNNISNGEKGRVQSKETKEKIKKGNIGLKTSNETKEKMRQAKIGKRHSPETKEKMRKSQQERFSQK